MEKSIYFYTINIPNSHKNTAISVQNVFASVFQQPNAKLNNGIFTYEYEDSGVDIRVDQIHQNKNLCFYRIGKEMNTAFAVKRDKSTLLAENLLDASESKSKIPDHTTFFLVDFGKNILSFVNSQAAPSASSLSSIARNIFNDLFIEILPIVNPQRINALYKRGAVLSEIEISIPIPSPEILASLNLPHGTIEALGESSATRAKLSIKADPYKPVTKVPELIEKMLKALENSVLKNKTKARGSEPGNKGQSYSFVESQIVYKVELPTIAMVDGMARSLTTDEIAIAAGQAITVLYEQHKDDLSLYSNSPQ